MLNAIADAAEKNKDMLAVAESWENGKPVRETLAADIPLVVDHFRYFAAAARAEEGRSTEIEKDLVPTTSGSRWVWWSDNSVQLPDADGHGSDRQSCPSAARS